MKVLVTGAAGTLGTTIVKSLLSRGYDDIRCVVRHPSRKGTLDAVAASHADARIEILAGSLRDADAARGAIAGIDTVFHLASGMSGAFERIHADTVVASSHLVSALLRIESPPVVVLASSIAVYGVADKPPGAIINEACERDKRHELRDSYTRAKIEQDRLFQSNKDRFPVVTMRPGLLLSPGARTLPSRVGLKLGGVFFAVGPRRQLPVTWVENCADAFIMCASNSEIHGREFNVIDDDLPTTRDYAAEYRRAGGEVPIALLPSALSDIARRVAGMSSYKARSAWGGHRFDNTRLKSSGWSPVVSMDSALERHFHRGMS